MVHVRYTASGFEDVCLGRGAQNHPRSRISLPETLEPFQALQLSVKGKHPKTKEDLVIRKRAYLEDIKVITAANLRGKRDMKKKKTCTRHSHTCIFALVVSLSIGDISFHAAVNAHGARTTYILPIDSG